MMFCPYFVDILSDVDKICTGNVHSSLLSYYEFCENWHMASHTLLKDVNEILYVLFTFIAQFWGNTK
jgi:hypothetical protein